MAVVEGFRASCRESCFAYYFRPVKKKKKKDNKTKQNPKPKLIIFQQSSQRLQQRARWRR